MRRRKAIKIKKRRRCSPNPDQLFNQSNRKYINLHYHSLVLFVIVDLSVQVKLDLAIEALLFLRRP